MKTSLFIFILLNDNLEQQAQALFKEWFIDNPEKKNWSNGTFSDLIQSTLSGDWGKEVATRNNTEKVYCIRGADIPEVKSGNKGKMPIRYILPKNYASKKLNAGDIVVEIYINLNDVECWCLVCVKIPHFLIVE